MACSKQHCLGLWGGRLPHTPCWLAGCGPPQPPPRPDLFCHQNHESQVGSPTPGPGVLALLLLPWPRSGPGPWSMLQCSGRHRPCQDCFALFKKDRLPPPRGGLTRLRGSLGGSTEGLLWLMRKGAATLEDDKQPLMRESRWQTEGHSLTCRKRFLFPFTLCGGSEMRQKITVSLLHALLAFFSGVSLSFFLSGLPPSLC